MTGSEQNDGPKVTMHAAREWPPRAYPPQVWNGHEWVPAPDPGDEARRQLPHLHTTGTDRLLSDVGASLADVEHPLQVLSTAIHDKAVSHLSEQLETLWQRVLTASHEVFGEEVRGHELVRRFVVAALIRSIGRSRDATNDFIVAAAIADPAGPGAGLTVDDADLITTYLSSVLSQRKRAIATDLVKAADNGR